MARRNPPALPPQAGAAAMPRLGPAPSKRWRLEPRVLLDAALPVTLDVVAELASPADDAPDASTDIWASAAVLAQHEQAATRHELVVVDTSIDGWQALLADSLDDRQLQRLAADHGGRFDSGERVLTVLLLADTDDGIAAIDRALATADGYDAVHLFSHATEGRLELGSATIDSGDDVSNWRDGLRAGADILLYGCDVANGEAGISFVRSLAAASGADVAASTDPTGSSALGGDYDLELRIGDVTTPVLTGDRANASFTGLLVASATTSIDVPAEEFINESVRFTVSFDNAGTTPGYAPFFDLVVPAGITGVTSGTAFASGDVVLTTVGTWDTTLNGGAGGWRSSTGAAVTVHPYGAGLALPTGAAGATWSIADLPFGSFTQDQPAVVTAFTGLLNKSQGALVGNALTISARGGFRFGNDPLDNPSTDAPVQQGAVVTDSVTPQVIRFEKTNDRPENEVASGPNEPITYTLRVNVATGERLDLTQLADQLPANLQYLPGSLTFVTAPSNGTSDITLVADTNGTLVAGEFDEPTGGAPQTGANALLRLNYGTVVGRAGDDVVVTYRAFVPEFDAANARVIPAATGTNASIVNDASISATYDPDGNGALPAATITRNDTETLTAKPIAIQKEVAVQGGGDPLPGATLTYTLRVQLSDFFAMDQLVIDDRFSDGQVFDNTFTPTYVLANSGTTTAATAFAGGNVTVTRATGVGGNGDTDVQFRLSDQFVTDGRPARLDGDLFANDATQAGQTEVIITFRTRIEQNFFNVPAGVGDTSVDLGDVLTNTVTQTGRIIQDNLTPGSVVTDGSNASVTIESIDAAKSIYAINGVLAPTDTRVGPGDTVTYRIRLTLPSADVESLVVGDFLPLPVFEVGQMDTADGVTNGATNIITIAPGTLPAAGRIAFGPDQNLPALFDANGAPITLPTAVTVDTANNRFSIDFGSFDDGPTPATGPFVIDLLYTLTATDRPFADGLLLTNNAVVALNNTISALPDVSRIAQIQVSVPELRLTKGVVSSDATTSNSNEASLGRGGATFAEPGTTTAAFTGTISSNSLANAPITTNLTGVDNGDLVRFAIVIENTGSNDAFDLLIQDVLPADGLRVPPGGLNLKVTTGNGTALTFTGAATDLFTTGIRIVDPEDSTVGAGGAIAAHSTTAGSNIIVITYDLEVSDLPAVGTVVIPNALLANAATLAQFGGRNNGNDFTAGAEGPWNDSASARVAPPGLTKTLVGTAITDARNASNEAAIGELITYRVTLRLPEGTHPDLQLVDTLDAGLEFVDITSVSASTGLSSTSTLDLATVQANTVTSGSVTGGRVITLSLGTVTNSESDNSDAETIVVEYRVRAADIPQNTSTDFFNNNVAARENLDGNGANGSETTLATAQAANVQIIEPNLDITKTIAAGTRDNGSTVLYTVTIRNIAGSVGADAYGVTFSDVLPTGLTLVDFDSTHNNAGTAPTVTYNSGLRTLSAAEFDLQEGHSVTITIEATLDAELQSLSTITNTGAIAWTGLPGVDANERSYSDNASVNLTVAAPTLAKSRPASSIENANNPTGEAVVGELITYRLVLTLPEARMPTAAIRDVLDVGLDFVDIVAVTTSAGVTSSTIADLNNVAQLQAATTVATVNGNQDQLTIALGNLVNNNSSDGTAETITIDYRVRVLDIAANTAGTLRNNSADIRFDRNGDGDFLDGNEVVQTVSAPDTRIIQPVVTVDKTVSAPVADAQSPITYTIVLQNVGSVNGTDAYDLNFSDVLPTTLDGSAANVTVSALRSSGAPPPTFVYTEGTRTISAAAFDLAEGESVTITVNARIAEGVAPNTSIENQANLGYSTLPGTVAGERSLSANDTVTFATRNPTIGKVLIDTSVDSASNDDTEATIGELLTFEVTLTAPESTLPGVVLFDTLDAGLEFVAITQVTAASALSSNTTALDLAGVQAATTVSGAVATGQSLRIALGNVTNSDRNDAAIETIVVRYTVRVANDAAIVAAALVNNNASLLLDFDGDGNSTSNVSTAQSANVTIVEPVLVLDKSVNDTTAFQGQQVTYTLTVRHPTPTGATDTDAHDIRITDLLPSGLLLNVGSIQVSGAGVLSNASTGNTIDLTLDTLAVGSTASVTFTATVATNPAAIGASLANTAQLSWSSLPGAPAVERTGSGGVNDYTASDGASLTVTAVDLAITKSDAGITATPGGVVPYVLSYRNNGTEGAVGVVLRESVPTGSTFNTGASTAGWVNVGGSDYELTIGALAAGASGTATFAVTVTDPVAAGQSSLANTASIRDDNSRGPDTTAGDNSSNDSTPINAAPDYTISKTSAPTLPVQPGETVPYTLDIRNLGNENGVDVTIVDTFDPTLLQVNAASIVTPPGVTAIVDNVAGTITFSVTDNALVTAGNNFTIRYDTVVASTIAAGVTLIDGPASISGDNETNLANNSDDDVLTLVAAPDYTIAKRSSNPGNLAPGETFTYTITVRNVGDQHGTGVVVSDTLPDDVLRTDNLIISDGGSFDAGSNRITWNLGDLAAGASRELTVIATVGESVPPATELINQVSVADDGANGADPTPDNNTASDTDTVESDADYTVTKSNSAGRLPALPGDVVPFTLTAANIGRGDGNSASIVDRFDATALRVLGTSIVAPPGVSAVVDNVAGTITFTITDDALLRSNGSFDIRYDAAVLTALPAGLTTIAGSATISGANETNTANNSDPDSLPVNAQPDYTIAKSSSNTSALRPGDTFTYTITTTNVGNQAGTGVVVTDTLPQSLDATALVISDGGTFSATTNRITWNLGEFAAGATRVLTVTATVVDVVPVGVDTLVNSVSVTDDGANGVDPTPSNNTASDSDPLNAAPDYTVVKTSMAALPVEPGETVPFRLNIANIGNEHGAGASITDRFDPSVLQVDPTSLVLPAGVTAVVDNAVGTIVLTVVDDALVRAGAQFTVDYSTTVARTIPAGVEQLGGTASIAGRNEVNLTNNSDPEFVPLAAQPNYALTKSSTHVGHVEPGESVQYRLTMTNVGNQNGTTATIVDHIDSGLARIVAGSVRTPAGVSAFIDATAGTLVLSVNDPSLLVVGADFDIDYDVEIHEAARADAFAVANSATVTGAGDLDSSNDTSTYVLSLDAQPDYVISKVSSAAGATLPGETITYTITVENDGNQAGTNVVITDVLPSGVLDAPRAISHDGRFDASLGRIVWQLSTLAAGERVTLTFEATVVEPTPVGAESVFNSVSVTDDGANGADPHPEDNSATTNDVLQAAPDYEIIKVREPNPPPQPGITVDYLLIVRNVGNQSGSNVRVTDLYDPTVYDIDLAGLRLPTGVTGSIDATTGTISFVLADDLVEAGDSIEIGVTATVREPVRLGAETVINHAVVLGDDDPNLANNSSGTSEPLFAAPDYTVRKSNNATFPVTPGSRIDFTLDVANIGNQDGSNAVIVDTFDPRVLSIDPTQIVVPPGVTVGVDNLAGTITFRVTDDALVASGASFRIVIPTMVQGSVPVAAEDIASIVRIDGDDDANLTNNADPDNIPLSAAPDLDITKTTTASDIAPRGTLTYTLTVRNFGNQNASGVSFVDTYDASLVQIVSVTPINGTPSSGVTIVDNGAGQIRFVVTDAALTEVGDRLDYAIVARVTSSVPVGAESLRNSATVFAPDEGNFANNATMLETPLLASPDYSVRKSSSNAGVLAPGDTTTYTLRVRNIGNQDGSGVTVTDVYVPTAASVVEGSIVAPAGVVATVDADAGTISFLIPNAAMLANADFELRYDLRVSTTLASSAESLANIAVIRGDGDANPTNDASRVQLGVDAAPDVAITIDDGRTTVAPGEQPVYLVTIDNLGNQDASAVSARVLYDPAVVTIDLSAIVLPPGVTVSEPTPGTLVFSVGDLAVAAQPMEIRLPAVVATATAGTTGVLLQASVSASEDANPANNAAADLDVSSAAPDYRITKTSNNAANLQPGQSVTYTLTVQNVGNQHGTGVVVTDDLPAGLARTGVVVSDGGVLDATTGRVTWNLGNLDVGASRTLTVTATVLPALPAGVGELANRANVADDGRNGDDPTPANNTAIDTDPVTATPDLRVDVSDGVEVAQRGDVLTYRLDIANTGNQGATGTTVVFRFPPGSLVITATSVPAVIDPVAGTVTFDVGALPAGAAAQLTITARVADTAVPDAGGRIAVSSSITDDGANGADPTPANNLDNDVVFVDDQRNVVFFTDNGRRLADPGIPDGDRLRTHTYEQYPQWLHGRLISLETMQSDANLVGGRTEVKFDAQYGTWNHHFFPNPWNHDRADFTKNAEWLEEFVNWLGAQADELGDDLGGASLEKQIDAAVRGDRGALLRHLSKLSGGR